jgi:hypothetical protein
MVMKLHLNWGACADWQDARARLGFLKTVLYGNFAEIEGDPKKIRKQIIGRGFKVDCEPRGDEMLMRLSDNGSMA